MIENTEDRFGVLRNILQFPMKVKVVCIDSYIVLSNRGAVRKTLATRSTRRKWRLDEKSEVGWS